VLGRVPATDRPGQKVGRGGSMGGRPKQAEREMVMAEIRPDRGSDDDGFQEFTGSSTAPPVGVPLTIVQAGSIAELTQLGVDTKNVGFVHETIWALADANRPLATQGAGPCLVVVVHHRTSGRGGLAHISTTNIDPQESLSQANRRSPSDIRSGAAVRAGRPPPAPASRAGARTRQWSNRRRSRSPSPLPCRAPCEGRDHRWRGRGDPVHAWPAGHRRGR
jgi:hypothetical protein